MAGDADIRALRVRACRIPTDAPEADGTLSWDATTAVIVEVEAADRTGLGWSYTDAGAAGIVDHVLRPVVVGADAFDVAGRWTAMCRSIRNLGRAGVAATAVAAVDAAIWDLAARIAGIPLCNLLGRARDRVDVYGSGGFTSYGDDRLREQLGGWVDAGIRRVKIKVGTHPDDDERRVAVAREAVGDAALFVDANGAWSRKQALDFAFRFADLGVSWLEEPVPSDDLEALRLVRDRGPAGMDVTAGEYGYDLPYFARMLAAGAVDVLQADATRCLGISGFLRVSALCEAAGVPMSAHCAPSLHLHAACACPPLVHVEWFHDHSRIEEMLFEGFQSPVGGALVPDLAAAGNGLSLKRSEADRWAA